MNNMEKEIRKIITLYLNENEYETLKELARRKHMTMSAYIRLLINVSENTSLAKLISLKDGE